MSGSSSIKKYMELIENVHMSMTEAQTIKVITYNSGHGERLDAVSRDQKRHRDAEMLGMQLGTGGQPEMKVRLDNQTYIANWDPQHGWVVNFD
jgi:hypothetical protein